MDRNSLRAAWCVAALLALGACAEQGGSAPAAGATTAFDGTYRGQSAFEGRFAACFASTPQPVIITINNGVVRMPWGASDGVVQLSGVVAGQVSADGSFRNLRFRYDQGGGVTGGREAHAGGVMGTTIDLVRTSGNCAWRIRAQRDT